MVVNGRHRRSIAFPACLSTAAAVLPLMAVGCSQTQRIFRPGTTAGTPAPALPFIATPPAVVPSPLPSYADTDGRQLAASLERNRQESQLMHDEIAALREQLASTSSQLAEVRSAGMPPRAPQAAAAAVGDPAISSPAMMQSALAQLALPGIEARFDGAVVRIELPADALFDSGTANLLPGGITLLTQVSTEVDRIYPGHYIGIEGHVDTEPLLNASWGSPHQLTAGRSAAVFDFLTSRTTMREGQLFLVAHGANHPVVSNATSAGRAKNRRIELVIYPERAPGSS